VELVTVGQRRGMGHGDDGRRRFVTAVDVPSRRVMLGPTEAAHAEEVRLHTVTWVDGDLLEATGDRSSRSTRSTRSLPAIAQCSAHGRPVPCTVRRSSDGIEVTFDSPQRRIAPGQTVALYDPDQPDAVIGSGIAGAG
jgi:tRNA-specific 2-thiouridylase